MISGSVAHRHLIRRANPSSLPTSPHRLLHLPRSTSLLHHRTACPVLRPLPIISSPSSSSPFFLLPLRRFAQAHVDELRSGTIIDYEGKMQRVVSHETHMRGRAHTTITLELREVSSGKSSSIRLRPSDKVEIIQLEQETLTFLYKDTDALHLMHPETFETIELPLSTVDASLLPFLTDNSTVRCTKRGKEYLGLALPEKVKVKVEKAEGRTGGMKGMTGPSEGRRALLENGVWIEGIPNAVNEGDFILVNTNTLTFAGKAE